MPQDLPGFYFDVEKNRYFPIKFRGTVPKSSSASASTSASSSSASASKHTLTQVTKLCVRTRRRMSKLLQIRELYGNIISLGKGKCNFREEFQKNQASQPVVWKYQGTEKIADGALEQISTNVETLEGETETDVLLTGGINGSLSFCEVGKVGQSFDYGVKCMPDLMWPLVEENQVYYSKAPSQIWRPVASSLQMSSNISCIKLSAKHSQAVDDSKTQHALITTLGSETSGGSLYILNLAEPLNFNPVVPIMRQRTHEVASFNCTIWTADCSSTGRKAAIGTNRGAALVDLETGMASWVCSGKSDILAQQLDESGNVILCGYRNGAIVTVDVRKKRERTSSRMIKIPLSSLGRSAQHSRKKWFELKGNIDACRSICMPSSISCLKSLKSYDQYFLASSMDGSVKLYDHRQVQKGAIQSYEGHVNSHTRTQLGVDPSERFVMSGGEDCNLRIWSIKSGEMLFEGKCSNSVPLTMCWQRSEGSNATYDGSVIHEEYPYCQNNSWGAWLGTQEGLYHVGWS